MLTMRTVKAGMCGFMLSLGLATTAAVPAEAQFQNGLVNVAIGDISTGDILSNNRVSVAIAANTAANVCGIQVQAGVLSALLNQQGYFKCTNGQSNKFVQVTN